jgi:hypothetical protein
MLFNPVFGLCLAVVTVHSTVVRPCKDYCVSRYDARSMYCQPVLASRSEYPVPLGPIVRIFIMDSGDPVIKGASYSGCIMLNYISQVTSQV